MPNDLDKVVEERIKNEILEYIPKIKDVIKKYSNSDMLVETLERCLKVFENPKSTIDEKRKALVIIENSHLDLLLSSGNKKL